MSSPLEICNRGLQLLGAETISSLNDNNKSARACKLAYDNLRKAELRSRHWNFAIKRANLAADVTTPVFGKSLFFPLPEDFLDLAQPDPEGNFNTLDYQIEGRSIATNNPAPIQIRYVYDCQDVTMFDPLFCEGLSAKIAFEICYLITQSNSNREALKEHYKEKISEARSRNAFENRPTQATDDTYLMVRG